MNMNPLTAKEAKEWSYKMRLRFQKNVLRNIERSVMMGKTSVDKINKDEYAIDTLQKLGYEVKILSSEPKFLYGREQFFVFYPLGLKKEEKQHG